MEVYTFTESQIIDPVGYEIMHEWEYPIMQKKAEWVCTNGGDIIEFGFGMGISATLIQSYNIHSHTICENHPQVLEKLYEWAHNKPNVTVLEGDWYDNRNQMEKYDGVLFDTFKDLHAKDFPNTLKSIANQNCHVTWWNNLPEEFNEFKMDNTQFEVLNVDPPQNYYFNHKHYYMPKYIYNHG